MAAGYISGAHGIRGEIILVSQIHDIEILEDKILLGKDGDIREFSVSSLRPHKGDYLLASKDIPDRNAAERLRGYTWFVVRAKMISQENENIFLHEIEGFVVRDDKMGAIGKIVGFSSNGAQDLLEVESNKGKVFVPLIKPFLVKIDFAAKTVFMNLPEGLI